MSALQYGQLIDASGIRQLLLSANVYRLFLGDRGAMSSRGNEAANDSPRTPTYPRKDALVVQLTIAALRPRASRAGSSDRAVCIDPFQTPS